MHVDAIDGFDEAKLGNCGYKVLRTTKELDFQ